MNHALGDLTIDVPEDLQDFSDYSYESPKGDAILIVQLADRENVDADVLLANAAERYRRMYGPLIIYSQPHTVHLADGAAAPAIEGEQRDMNDRSRRLRFALVAVASDRGKALLIYSGPAASDALSFLVDTAKTVRYLGDAAPSSNPKRRKVQAGHLVFTLPVEWSEPRTLVFRADFELRVTTTEPLAPQGFIDLSHEFPQGSPRILKETLSAVTGRALRGWAGEWLVQDDQGQRTIVRKTSAGGDSLVITAYEKGSASSQPSLDAVWAGVRSRIDSWSRNP
jgi:hypothetical protein